MKEKFVVDRIEDNSIVLEGENKGIILIDSNLLKEEILEGYVLIEEDNMYIIDKGETKNRKIEINNLLEGVWEW